MTGDEDEGARQELLAAHTQEVTLPGGGRIRLRPVLPEDKEELAGGFERLSPESRYFRFFSHLDHLSAEQLRYLTELDYDDHFALAAFDLDDPDQSGVGVARYVRAEHDDTDAELAVAVLDDHHGRGIGVALIRALAAVAVEHDVTHFVAYFLRDNHAMRDVFEFLGAQLSAAEPGVVHAELAVPLQVDLDADEDVAPAPADW